MLTIAAPDPLPGLMLTPGFATPPAVEPGLAPMDFAGTLAGLMAGTAPAALASPPADGRQAPAEPGKIVPGAADGQRSVATPPPGDALIADVPVEAGPEPRAREMPARTPSEEPERPDEPAADPMLAWLVIPAAPPVAAEPPARQVGVSGTPGDLALSDLGGTRVADADAARSQTLSATERPTSPAGEALVSGGSATRTKPTGVVDPKAMLEPFERARPTARPDRPAPITAAAGTAQIVEMPPEDPAARPLLPDPAPRVLSGLPAAAFAATATPRPLAKQEQVVARPTPTTESYPGSTTDLNDVSDLRVVRPGAKPSLETVFHSDLRPVAFAPPRVMANIPAPAGDAEPPLPAQRPAAVGPLPITVAVGMPRVPAFTLPQTGAGAVAAQPTVAGEASPPPAMPTVPAGVSAAAPVAATPVAAAPVPATPVAAPVRSVPAEALIASARIDEPTVAAPDRLLDGATVAGSPITVVAPAPPQQATGPGIDLTRDQGLHRIIDRIELLRDAAADGANARDTRIRLIPDALGPVEIAVRREGEGVHVHFTATEAATRQLIADAQPRLSELAEQRGVRLERATVDAGSSGQGGEAGQPRPQPHQPAQPARPPRAPRADTAIHDDRIA